MFGPLEFARENLGGLVPVKEVEYILAKENLSLVTLEEPLFSPVDEVEKMKLFLPKRLPGFLSKIRIKEPKEWFCPDPMGRPF